MKRRIICYLLIALFISGIFLSENQSIAAGRIKISSKKLTIVAPNTKQLYLKQNGKKISKGVKWSSNNKKVATVSKRGKIKAKGVGSTVIIAKYKKKKYKCKITVKAPKYSITDTDITLNIGDTKQINLAKGTTVIKNNVKWSSNNSSIAQVSKTGLIKAVSSGEAVISAISYGKEFKCKVKVRETVKSNMVVLDNDYIKVTTKKYYYDEKNDMKLSFLIENKSTLNLSICAYSYSVNGITLHEEGKQMHTNVMPGKKATGTFTLEKEIFDNLDISSVRELKILFWGYDNAKNFKEFESEVVQIKTNVYDSTVNKKFIGKTLYNKNGIKVDYLKKDGDTYYYVITNTTGSYIHYDLSGLTVNDFTSSKTDLDNYDECVFNDEQALMKIKPDLDFLKENDINKINKIEFYLKYRLNDYYLDKSETDVIVTLFN